MDWLQLVLQLVLEPGDSATRPISDSHQFFYDPFVRSWWLGTRGRVLGGREAMKGNLITRPT